MRDMTQLEPAAAKHGDVRNHREETEYGQPVQLVGPDGAVVYDGPLSSHTFTVEERYCASCREWIIIKGLMGILLFEFEHKH